MDIDHFERVQQGMYAEIERARKAGAVIATAALIYVFIDAMAWARMPAGKADNVKSDFIDWVNRYMTPYGPKSYEYHYNGADLYQARCSLVHTMSSESAKTPMRFGYMDDGPPHRYRPEIDKSVVILNLASLRDDFFAGVARFVADVKGGADEALVLSRFEKMYGVIPARKREDDKPPERLPAS